MTFTKRFQAALALLALLAVAATAVTAAARITSAGGPPGAESCEAGADGCGAACALPQGKKATIATAKLIIEYNSTDDDIGVHGAFDDHGWSELCVYDPKGALILATKPQGQLKDLTMAGIFFESREPPSAEFSFEDLKARFPEGQYRVEAITFEGVALTGSATFTHNVPAPPAVSTPPDGAVVPLDGLLVEWADVTQTVDGKPLTITGYEVIITKEDHNDPHGFSQPIYDVHVSPDRNSLSVPVEFLEPGTTYELEVLALERSGNQTISVSFFETQ